MSNEKLTKQEYKDYRKQCDERLMSFINNDWSVIESLNIGDVIELPANSIAPDSFGEWLDAKTNNSMTDSMIEIHIGLESIISIRDGHNRMMDVLAKNNNEMIKVEFKGKSY